MALTRPSDYRNYLREALESRMAANSKYSLRAFARDLRISPQMLSFVLNGKKNLSSRSAAVVMERLGLDPFESAHFLDLVQKRAKYLPAQTAEFKALDVDIFRAISDWHHYAILELTFISGFKSDAKWIAKRVGITPFEAQQALERLIHLGLLTQDRFKRLRKTDASISTGEIGPSAALRKLARQWLQKAIDSLESQSVDERDITNITMAVDPTRLPEAKLMISDFRRKLCAFLEQGDRTEVYVFAPSLFRITRPTSKGKTQ